MIIEFWYFDTCCPAIIIYATTPLKKTKYLTDNQWDKKEQQVNFVNVFMIWSYFVMSSCGIASLIFTRLCKFNTK